MALWKCCCSLCYFRGFIHPPPCLFSPKCPEHFVPQSLWSAGQKWWLIVSWKELSISRSFEAWLCYTLMCNTHAATLRYNQSNSWIPEAALYECCSVGCGPFWTVHVVYVKVTQCPEGLAKVIMLYYVSHSHHFAFVLHSLRMGLTGHADLCEIRKSQKRNVFFVF